MELDRIIDEIIEKISDTTTLLYQEDKVEGFKNLELVIGQLIYLVEAVAKEDESVLGSENIQELNMILLNCVNAMEQGDIVLISDIINYDLVDILTTIKNVL